MSGGVKNCVVLLISAWRERRSALLRMLRGEPLHRDAWLWRIHARVLRFMLRRYGDSADIAPYAGFAGPDPRLWIEPNFGAPPRSRESIRIILERISRNEP